MHKCYQSNGRIWMFQKFLVSMLFCFVLVRPAVAADTIMVVLVTGTAINTALDLTAALCAFKSKDELSTIEHEPRRANMEGATATYGLGTLFSVLGIPLLVLPQLRPFALPALGLAMASQTAGASLSASTFGSDRHHPPAPVHDTYPYLDATFGLGLTGLVTHLATFLGTQLWQLQAIQATQGN